MATVTKRKEKKKKRIDELLKSLCIDKSKVEETGVELGMGSYGRVVELKVNGAKCAGKKLYREAFQSSQSSKILEQFADECIRLSTLRHPNIVQFLGLVIENESSTIMITEILQFSLSKCLSLYPDIPLHLKNTILLDVALGLVHLHSKGIIHRDLSSNNVLLTSALQAKIADFGIAKVLTSCQDFSMTMLHGTADFMPPEATIANAEGRVVYDYKMDIFSFGHMVLHIAVQRLVSLLPKVRIAPDGAALFASEISRRKELFDLMGERHHLRELACLCLRDDPSERLTAVQIVDIMEGFCTEMKPTFSNTLELIKRISTLESEMAAKNSDLCGSDGRPVEPTKAEPTSAIADPGKAYTEASAPLREGTQSNIDVQQVSDLVGFGSFRDKHIPWPEDNIRNDQFDGDVPHPTQEDEWAHVYVNVLRHCPRELMQCGIAGAKDFRSAKVKPLPKPLAKARYMQPDPRKGPERNPCSVQLRRSGAECTVTRKGPGSMHQHTMNCSGKMLQETAGAEFSSSRKIPVPKPRRDKGVV